MIVLTNTDKWNIFNFFVTLAAAFGVWVIYLKVMLWKKDEWFPTLKEEDKDKKSEMIHIELISAFVSVVACLLVWYVLMIPSTGSLSVKLINPEDYIKAFFVKKA